MVNRLTEVIGNKHTVVVVVVVVEYTNRLVNRFAIIHHSKLSVQLSVHL